MFKTDVVGTSQGRRNADLTLGPIRVSLGRLFEIYETFDKVICFFFPGGTLNLYLKNVVVIDFIEFVKLTFSGRT